MSNKKSEMRFTIQFNQDNPLHLRAAAILNGLNPRGKARYVTDALLHYENCGETPKIGQPVQTDVKEIEKIVRRILHEKRAEPFESPQSAVYSSPANALLPDNAVSIKLEDVDFDEATAALDDETMSAIANTLEMLRSR